MAVSQPTQDLLPEPSSAVEYVRLSEAADRLKISEDTLDRAIRPGLVAGEIVSYKFGRVRTISWRSLLAYLDKYYAGGIQPKRGKR